MTAYIVTDLGFGDAGKGTTVDWLARQAKSLIVRHSGGAQAAHNVITPDGRHHTFSQFGSGSFAGATTFLSRFMLVNPITMLNEAEHLIELGETDIWNRLYVDENALVTTPWHRAANQLRELTRGTDAHGSCGMGIGETMHDSLTMSDDCVIRVKDLHNPFILQLKLSHYRQAKYYRLMNELPDSPSSDAEEDLWNLFVDDGLWKETHTLFCNWYDLVNAVPGDYLRYLVEANDQVVFEGSQGVLLDEDHGFHPYTTWARTTHVNAKTLLDEINYDGEVVRMGVIRSYMTRHGAGPFVTEDPSLAEYAPEPHNGIGRFQGAFRYGWLDVPALRYAINACEGIDQLVVTHCDRIDAFPELKICVAYRTCSGSGFHRKLNMARPGELVMQEMMTKALSYARPVYERVAGEDYLNTVGDKLGLPVGVASYGPTADNKRALARVLQH